MSTNTATAQICPDSEAQLESYNVANSCILCLVFFVVDCRVCTVSVFFFFVPRVYCTREVLVCRVTCLVDCHVIKPSRPSLLFLPSTTCFSVSDSVLTLNRSVACWSEYTFDNFFVTQVDCRRRTIVSQDVGVGSAPSGSLVGWLLGVGVRVQGPSPRGPKFVRGPSPRGPKSVRSLSEVQGRGLFEVQGQVCLRSKSRSKVEVQV